MERSDASSDYSKKSSERPQSMLALSLAAQIDSAFSLDGPSDIDSLAKSVDYKKHNVDLQAQELHQLEARLRETEERLRKQQQQQTQTEAQRQQQPSLSTGSSYPHYQNSASASQTSFQGANSYSGSPALRPSGTSSSSRPSSRAPSVQQMNQSYQYLSSSPAQRYGAGAPSYAQQQQQAYTYRAASSR